MRCVHSVSDLAGSPCPRREPHRHLAGKSDKDPAVTILKLRQLGDSVSGTWQPAQGNPSEIENGKIVGETLTFSFARNTHPINATGHLSGDAISFDLTGHKWGMSKTVHRTATRIALN
jgi:hypothetical protein